MKGITLIQFTAQTAVTRPAQPLYPSTSFVPLHALFYISLTLHLFLLYIPSFKHIQSPILNMPGMVVLQQLNTERDGVALKSISDEMDEINVLKDQARKQIESSSGRVR